MAQDLIGSPVLRQFDDGARQIAVELFEFGFEAGEQGEGVGGGTGESGDNLVVIESAQLARRGFEHFGAERYLAIARHDHFSIATHAEHRRGTNSLLHFVLKFQCNAAVRKAPRYFRLRREQDRVNCNRRGKNVRQRI